MNTRYRDASLLDPVVSTIRTPLAFFASMLLLIEGILGLLAFWVARDQMTIILTIMAVLFLTTFTFVAYLVVKRPHNLYAPADFMVTLKEKDDASADIMRLQLELQKTKLDLVRKTLAAEQLDPKRREEIIEMLMSLSGDLKKLSTEAPRSRMEQEPRDTMQETNRPNKAIDSDEE